jgi:hypothetical protein
VQQLIGWDALPQSTSGHVPGALVRIWRWLWHAADQFGAHMPRGLLHLGQLRITEGFSGRFHSLQLARVDAIARVNSL